METRDGNSNEFYSWFFNGSYFQVLNLNFHRNSKQAVKMSIVQQLSWTLYHYEISLFCPQFHSPYTAQHSTANQFDFVFIVCDKLVHKTSINFKGALVYSYKNHVCMYLVEGKVFFYSIRRYCKDCRKPLVEHFWNYLAPAMLTFVALAYKPIPILLNFFFCWNC